MNETIIIQADDMASIFAYILERNNFSKVKAQKCAGIFTSNSIDGVYTHGVNRFPRFIQYVKEGLIQVDAEPSIQQKFGAIEQWDGNAGPGVLNAVKATDQAIDLAKSHGIGCVALANTNHWMRGGYYGWHAAKSGVVLVAWTNTIGIMPAFGGTDARLGNNPFVIAIPYKNEAIVLDMAMSQFSFGTMELAVMKNEKLPVIGGYDNNGEVTNDPSAILEAKRPLPIGYWKGAGFALLLDILATILSAGLSTGEITKQQSETSVSQVFIAIDLTKLSNHSQIAGIIDSIIKDYHKSIPADNNKPVRYPGERVLRTRAENLKNGIPVLKSVWEKVLEL